jgi:hypothetical protein
MLSLEVMGPGGSLSTVLIATPYRRDASWTVSWQAATVTAAYSCDRTTVALVHWLGSGWRQQRRSGPVSSATDSKFVYSIVFHSCLYSALFVPNLPRFYSAFFNRYKIPHTYSDRPVKIGPLYIWPLKILILCVVSFPFALLSFLQRTVPLK